MQIVGEEDSLSIGRLGKPRYLGLGLDPGIASLGFALIDLANWEILELGVRLFPAPVVPKTGQSKAADRRAQRSIRRNNDRTQDRLKHCLELLIRFSVVPEGSKKEYFHTVRGDKPPLRLRVEALDRRLTEREWALVLYSLCKRRGYISHGEGDSASSSDEGKVLKALSANAKALEGGEYRTVGEWLASQPRSRNRRGSYDKCISHQQLVREVRILFDSQRALGSPCATEEMERAYLEVFDWLRPRDAFDEHSYSLVGFCMYFPEDKRAARCTLSSELVSAYGAFGNVTMTGPGGVVRTLTAEERDAFISVLFSPVPVRGNKDCKVTYAKIRKALDLPASFAFKGVAFDDEKAREVYQPQGWRLLRATLKDSDQELVVRLRNDVDLADAVFEAVAYASSEAVLRQRLESLDLTDGEVGALVGLPFSSRALNGYGSRSKRALDLLLDAFDDPEVLTLTEAERESGLYWLRVAGPSLERSDRLMPYSSWLALTGRTNNNPVVHRSMAQMRKVVNAICREWGVPNLICVELSRDLRLSKRAKDEIARANAKNAKDNERIRKQIAGLCGKDPSAVKGSLIEKYRLWEEQGNRDAYTDAPIEVIPLLTDEKYTEIDHILPFSRTGDNSRHNKALVLATTNQNKGRQTPYEWIASGGRGAPSWDEFEARVRENHKLSPRKRSFLLECDLVSKEPEFQSRNLVDTAYMSREVCAYLSECLKFPEDGNKVHVRSTKGAATAWLRHAWGLNFGASGEKDRSDNRHHATDACVIAASSSRLVALTARISEDRHQLTKERRAELLSEAKPWPSFTEDVREKREEIIPTRYVPRKGRGELFKQTVYSYLGEDEKMRDLGEARDSTGKLKRAVMGNALVSADGKSVVRLGGMICLRLWHDKEAGGRGRTGRWYADPIYYADLQAIREGTYVPKISKAHIARKAWQPVPQSALREKHLEIYLQDVVCVDGVVGRFAGFDISSAGWKMVDLLTEEEIAFPTIASLDDSNEIKVIREDVLGHCWRNG